MSRRIPMKSYGQGQEVLFPESIDSYIESDSPVRLISEIVDQLDLSTVLNTYLGGGCSCYNPRMLLKILFYGYLNNIYSCRKLARAMRENIYFMWLSGRQFPKYTTINNFRSLHLKEAINDLFTQVVVLLVDMGYVSLKEQYVDGTKIESSANKYTFVWRKSVEKNKARLEFKISSILKQIDEGIVQDVDDGDDDPRPPIKSSELKERISEINKQSKSKEEQKQIRDIEKNLLPKLEEYEQKLEQMSDRNSYSKTDVDATFMRTKDDVMNNGQLKACYNLQISTRNQFITNFGLYPNPGDTLTLISFLESYYKRYGCMPDELCADAGYGSEENYAFMEQHGIYGYVKYNYFHKEQSRAFRDNLFVIENLYYNAEEDYFVCPNGKQLRFKDIVNRKSENGYQSELHLYESEDCNNCVHRCNCHRSSSNRIIQINHTLRSYKHKARELLGSQRGEYLRTRRSVEPEAVFGQIKANKQYKRFRHRGKDMVNMDFAIAFNIQKLHNKRGKTRDKRENDGQSRHFLRLYINIGKKYDQMLTKTMELIHINQYPRIAA